MSKFIKKQGKIHDFHVDLALNGRDPSDVDTSYDLESMIPQIMGPRRIIQPLICEMRPLTGKESEGDKLVVLAGNRRALTGQRIADRPDCPADVLANLQKVEYLLYSELSDEERYAFVFDQGSQKGLADHEIVQGIWRMYSESYFNTSAARDRILEIQYHNLGKFTSGLPAIQGKLSKLDKNDRAAKMAELRKHFHGTLDNVILGVYGMGAYCKAQYLLTLKKKEALLKDGEKVEMEMKTVRITELSKAKNEDKKGPGWNAADGGPKFNQTIAKFKAEDASGEAAKRSTRPTSDALLKVVDNYNCAAIAKAIKMAAGVEGPQVAGLMEDNDRLYRMEKVLELLLKAQPSMPNELKPLINAIIDNSPSKFQEYLRNEFKINVDL